MHGPVDPLPPPPTSPHPIPTPNHDMDYVVQFFLQVELRSWNEALPHPHTTHAPPPVISSDVQS